MDQSSDSLTPKEVRIGVLEELRALQESMYAYSEVANKPGAQPSFIKFRHWGDRLSKIITKIESGLL